MKTENSEILEDFVRFCETHPGLRFWQALLNWSGQYFILFSKLPPTDIDDTTIDSAELTNPYYFKGKDR